MVSPILAALDQVERSVKVSKTFIAGTRDLSYGTLFDRVARLTTLFRNMGLEREDRAIISSRDDLSLVTLFVALVRNGIAAVVLDPDAPISSSASWSRRPMRRRSFSMTIVWRPEDWGGALLRMPC
jgi:acyl-CoA synthetase (AMP-forming)/AMP-acid ligase II